MKKFIIIIFIFVVFIGGLCVYYIKSFENQIENQRVNKIYNAKAAMVEYLSQKGLNAEEYDLFVDYRLDSKLLGYGGYVITVTYKDEPNVTYGYNYVENGKISSKSVVDNADSNNKNFKHEN